MKFAMQKNEWTLTEIARLLNQPQHRLIYFCEKKVIKPDGKDASGRGSSRIFSARNLFEFEVALTLWKFHIPAPIVRKVILVLDSFQRVLEQSLPEFELPYSLIAPSSPLIRAYLVDGSNLHFVIGEGSDASLIGGVDLEVEQNNIKWPIIQTTPRNHTTKDENSCIRPAGSERAYFEINLTQIAKELPIEQKLNSTSGVS